MINGYFLSKANIDKKKTTANIFFRKPTQQNPQRKPYQFLHNYIIQSG